MISSSRLVNIFFYLSWSCIVTLLFYRDRVACDYDRQALDQETTSTNKFIEKNNKSLETGLKYILMWSKFEWFSTFMGKGRQGFIDSECPYTNCFVTSDINYLGSDYTKFDVIAIHGPEVVQYSKSLALPSDRSLDQKFIFLSRESSDNYPHCNNQLEGYFNWTWTYKLDSDFWWGYMVVRDSNKKVIGPNKIMHWMDLQDMDPVSEDLELKLKSKSKAAAWLVSNCDTISKREQFVKNLKIELNTFNLSVDVYGGCGNLKCRDDIDCSRKIEEDYYFYLSFENSFSEDYVTEKLLHALLNNAVPVVFGGANYTRFLPNGSYLNARELGEEKLASTMNDLIKNPDQYYEYFRWKNHYSIHKTENSVDTNVHCKFCAVLNDEELMNKMTILEKFKEWWTLPRRCK